MAIVTLPPAPSGDKDFTSSWNSWLVEVKRKLANTNQTHNALASIQGGIPNQYYHITSAQASALSSGFSGTIVTAKLTLGGSNGSMTFSNGILISQIEAT